MKRGLLVSILFVVGCSGNGGPGSAPRLTAAMMPPGAEGLSLGVSTEAQVTAKLAGATVAKDKSMGGSGVVKLNDKPAEMLDVGHTHAALTPDASGALRLSQLELHGAGLCDWVKKTIAPMPGSQNCRGNRVTGDRNGAMFYCAATEDGVHRVTIDCNRNTGPNGDYLELWLFE